MAKTYIIGNWKMHGITVHAHSFAAQLSAKWAETDVLAHVILCPPAPLLPTFKQVAQKTALVLGGQDCHPSDEGAYTGDISARLLADLGCGYCIIGHSERRRDYGETNELVARKAAACLRADIVPIICVGETKEHRQNGQALEIVEKTLRESLCDGVHHENVIVAYEPIWAIGSGETPSVAEISEMHSHIRTMLQKHFPDASEAPIVYGGSVNGNNARVILQIPEVTGVIVGNASLRLEEFWKIIDPAPSL